MSSFMAAWPLWYTTEYSLDIQRDYTGAVVWHVLQEVPSLRICGDPETSHLRFRLNSQEDLIRIAFWAVP